MASPIADQVEGSDVKDLVQALEPFTLADVLPGQHYKHYKTGTTYVIVAVGLYEPNLLPMVHYRDMGNPTAITWTRTLTEFTASVPVAGTMRKRFERVWLEVVEPNDAVVEANRRARAELQALQAHDGPSFLERHKKDPP